MIFAKERAIIVRLSTKLAPKIKATPRDVLPLDPNPVADWSGHIFEANLAPFLIFSNSASLYSTVFSGEGIASESDFIECARRSLGEALERDGMSRYFSKFIEETAGPVQFSKPLSRSLTSTLSDLANRAKLWLAERNSSPLDTTAQLNELPLAPFGFRNPKEVLDAALKGRGE